MSGNIKQYLAGIAPVMPAEIISADTYDQINNMADSFGDFAASEYIMETNLLAEVAEADFSFRVLAEEKDCLIDGLNNSDFSVLAADETWNKVINFVNSWSQDIKDIWLEMDYGEYKKEIPQPCFFFNAGSIKKGAVVDDRLLYGTLKQLIDREQLQLIWPVLKEVIEKLPLEVGLFQIGVMLARNSEQVRIFTDELTREQVGKYLSDIGWTGSIRQVENILQLVHTYSDGQYILDFDVSKQGISQKIGVNFGLYNYDRDLSAFLNALNDNQMCTDVKRQGVLAWSGSKGSFLGSDYGYTALIKNISHFKISFLPEQGLQAKAYLRVAGVYMKELFKNQSPAAVPHLQTDSKTELPAYRAMQNTIKEIAQRSMLDKDYRELCLRDSHTAIQAIRGAKLSDNLIFLEEDQGNIPDSSRVYYVLPPFLKPSWLTNK